MMAIPRANNKEDLPEILCQLILPCVNIEHRDQKAVEIDYRILTTILLLKTGSSLELESHTQIVRGPSEE